jgi:3-mercaptopyruvate sulfurtransferase SseA
MRHVQSQNALPKSLAYSAATLFKRRRRAARTAALNEQHLFSNIYEVRQHTFTAKHTLLGQDSQTSMMIIHYAGRNAKEEFKTSRIPGSQFFDIDGVANTAIPLPHMVPSEASFSAAASALNVKPETTVVLYDRVGNWSSPRAWWTWKIFGHDRYV